MKKSLIEFTKKIPKLIESDNTKCAFLERHFLRYLERIGDHAVFMSDAINYIVTGKHRPSQERIDSTYKARINYFGFYSSRNWLKYSNGNSRANSG